MARPSSYSPKTTAIILRRLAAGETLTRICGKRRARGLPCLWTVYDWLDRHEDFKRAYLEARRRQREHYGDEIIDICDGKDDDAAEPRDVRRDRLRFDGRKFALSAPHLHTERRMFNAPERPNRPFEDDRAKAARIAAIFESARRREERGED